MIDTEQIEGWSEMSAIAKRKWYKRNAERRLRTILRVTASTNIFSHMNSKERSKEEREAYKLYLKQIEEAGWIS